MAPAKRAISREDKTDFLAVVFVSLLVVANLMGAKITHIGAVNFSVGLLVFPFTFLITDIIAEVHGKKRAKKLVTHAFFALIGITLVSTIFVALPFAERSLIKEEYTAVFSASIRILIASIIAFYLSQTHDVHTFIKLKQKSHGKFLWLRNNVSTMISQLIDTALFYSIAFLHIPFLPAAVNTPERYNLLFILTLMLPYYGLKVVMALLDTPLVYLGVRWLRKSETAPR